MGVPFDPETAWDERKQIYNASEHIFKTTHTVQSAEGDKRGLWTSVVAVAVFVE